MVMSGWLRCALAAGAMTVLAISGPASAAPPAKAPGFQNAPGFQPTSASFLSATTGFVLGTVNCPLGHSCKPWLVRTGDGGARWQVLPAPPRAGGDGAVLFASKRTGWLYGQGLWVTTDGGNHWGKLPFRGQITAMAVAAGTAYAVAAAPRAFTTELLRSPVGHSAWRRVGALSTAPEPAFEVFGRSAWLGSGHVLWATSDGRSWHRYRFACAGASYVLTAIAAASATQVRFLCTNSADFNTAEEGMEIMTSADGGRTEHLAGRTAPITGDGGVIAVPPGRGGVITFATSVGLPSYIDRSANGGRTFTPVFTGGDGSWLSLAYVSPATGWVVEGHDQLLRTTDAGHSWHKVTVTVAPHP